MERELVSFDGTERCRTDIRRPDRYRDLQPLVEWTRSARGPRRRAQLHAGLRDNRGRDVDSRPALRPLPRPRRRDRHRVTIEPGVTVGHARAVRSGTPLARSPCCPGHPSHHGRWMPGLQRAREVAARRRAVLRPRRGTDAVPPRPRRAACSRHENPEVFELTLGGMGLTGYISSLTLQLPALPGHGGAAEVCQVGDLVEAVDVMTAHCDTGAALYSWNDLNRRQGFGRGMVFVESFVGARSGRAAPPIVGSSPGAGRRARAAGSRPAVSAVNLGFRIRERAAAGRRPCDRGRGLPHPRQRGLLPAVRPAGVPRVPARRPYRGMARTPFPRSSAAVHAADVPVTLGSLKLFAGDAAPARGSVPTGSAWPSTPPRARRPVVCSAGWTSWRRRTAAW